MKEKTTLLSLPPELLEYVAECVDPTDICSMRLVSREVEAKVSRAYLITHFQRREFALHDASSLGMALKIARHPVVGKALKSIKFLLDIPDSGGWREFSISEMNIIGVEWEETAAYEHEAWIKRAENDEETTAHFHGSVASLLLELFSELGSHGKIEAVTIAEINPNEDISWNKSIEIVLSAIQTVHIPSIKWLSISGSKSFQGVELHLLTPSQLKLLLQMIKQLDHLRLDMTFVALDENEYQSTRRVLADVLEACKNLQTLVVGMAVAHEWGPRDETLIPTLKTVRFSQLKSLTLSTCGIRPLRDFVGLANMCPKLHFFSLEGCWIASETGAKAAGESFEDLLKRLTRVEEVEIDEYTREWSTKLEQTRQV